MELRPPQNPCSIQEPLVVSFPEALESWSPMSNFENIYFPLHLKTTDAITELVTEGSMIKSPINLVFATPLDSNKVLHVVTMYILESV